jgi:copper chaperone CopZ
MKKAVQLLGLLAVFFCVGCAQTAQAKVPSTPVPLMAGSTLTPISVDIEENLELPKEVVAKTPGFCGEIGEKVFYQNTWVFAKATMTAKGWEVHLLGEMSVVSSVANRTVDNKGVLAAQKLITTLHPQKTSFVKITLNGDHILWLWVPGPEISPNCP